MRYRLHARKNQGRSPQIVPDISYGIEREGGEEVGVGMRGGQYTIGRRVLPSMLV